MASVYNCETGQDEHYEPIKCPKCGKEGASYVEEIASSHDVLGYDESGKLTISAFYETDGFDENGDNPRLVCDHCCHEWEVPDNIEWI